VHIPSGCRFHPRCPLVTPECPTIDPELRTAKDGTSPDHRAACILV
jgi:peptide/nickel transport system ATP-binding protein